MVINEVQCDWITATSYDYEFYRHWNKQLESWGGEKEERRIMQYLGMEKIVEEGTIRLLIGSQNDREHYLLHLTSSLAHKHLPEVANQCKQALASTTRIDLQVTIPKPNDWNQIKFFNAQYERSKVTWIDSMDKKSKHKLETVGIGSRHSDRYCRMYTKLAEGELYLRFEVEYKHDRAKAVMRELSRDLDRRHEILLHELLKLKSKMAEKYFYMAIDADEPFRVRVKRVTSASKTNAWLVETVLPVMVRQLADHDQDGDLWNAFFSEFVRVGRYLGKFPRENDDW